MKQLFITLIILSCAFGCGRKNEPASDRAALILCEQNLSQKISETVVREVEEIISKHPDSDEPHFITLDPIVKLILDDTTYAIEENEIILMHDKGTKIWNSKGIQKTLIKSIQGKIKPNQKFEPTPTTPVD